MTSAISVTVIVISMMCLQVKDVSTCSGLTCADGRCSPNGVLCDGVVSCKDGSDEINCECSDPPIYDIDPHMVCEYTTVGLGQPLQCGCQAGYNVVSQYYGGVCIPLFCSDSKQWKVGIECSCELQDPPQQTGCGTDEFYCWGDGQCIPASQRCDGTSQCGSGEDEEYCLGRACLPCICGVLTNGGVPGCGTVVGDEKCGEGCQRHQGHINCGCGSYLIREKTHFKRCTEYAPDNWYLKTYDFKSCAADQLCSEVCIGILFEHEVDQCGKDINKSITQLSCYNFARVFWSGMNGCSMKKSVPFGFNVVECELL